MTDAMFRSTFRLLLLLTVFVLVTVGSENEQPSLDEVSGFATTPRTTENSKITAETRKPEPGKASAAITVSEATMSEEKSWGEVGDEDAEDEDDEDDEVDEYEEELREIAESHEAMSRDDRRNEISSTSSPTTTTTTKPTTTTTTTTTRIDHVGEDRRVGNRSGITSEFHSFEKNSDFASDENPSSNEAIPNDDDEDVAELLKYKQKVTTTLMKKDVIAKITNTGLKTKRVPTVKKELSTQKEIIASNDTHPLTKTSITNLEVVNRLDDDGKQERGYSSTITARDGNRYELVRGDMGLEEYTDVDGPGDLPRQLDKRRTSDGLNDPSSRFPAGGYASEHEQQRKLRELGIEEANLAESLMELLTRLAEDPRRWERMHRLFHDVEEDIEMARNPLNDSKKRAHTDDDYHPATLETQSSTPNPSKSATSKKPKKKKKKKKPRHRPDNPITTPTMPTTTTTLFPIAPTSIPFVPALLTTTESPWPTKPSQWRLVAERLFGSPWSDNLSNSQQTPLQTKQRYPTPEKFEVPKSLTSTNDDRNSRINDKQRDTLKALNNERQALMLQSAREYSQPRRLHYGKINTHEKDSTDSNDNDESSKNFDIDSRTMDYDYSPRNYHRQSNVKPHDRYEQYNRPRIHDYEIQSMNRRPNDYNDDDDDVIFNDDESTNRRTYARSQSFRPNGRDYASAKTWHDARYDHPRPWKPEGRDDWNSRARTTNDRSWKSFRNDYQNWIMRYRPSWREKNYRRLVSDLDDEITDDVDDWTGNDDRFTDNWRIGSRQRDWRDYPDNSAWTMNDDDDDQMWPSVADTPKDNRYPKNLETEKNPSQRNDKDAIVKTAIKDKSIVPKITMKTWNSLTSDPATWPFKLNGAKPWPKDKNGNTYNPNAELVRKLGLDKQDRLLSSSKDNTKGHDNIHTDHKNSNNLATRTNRLEIPKNEKMSNKNTWPEKLTSVGNWETGKSRSTDELPQGDDSARAWRENDDKLWSGKSPITSKISGMRDWSIPADRTSWKSYDVKNSGYVELSDAPRSGWPEVGSSRDPGTDTWSSQKTNDDWRLGQSDFGNGKSASANNRGTTWPSKWRQFAYHKVTASPIAKPGSSSSTNEANGRMRNSYIAVSAVSPSKYVNNDWRKNDVEEIPRSTNRRTNFDGNDPSSQLGGNSDDGLWNQQRGNDGNAIVGDGSSRDPLTHELEELRRMPYWEDQRIRQQSQKRSNVIGMTTSTVSTIEASSVAANTTTAVANEKPEAKLTKISDTDDVQSQRKKDIAK